MGAGNHDFEIEQGVDLSVPIQIKNKATGNPVDITSWTFACQLREKFSDVSALLTPTVTVVDVSLGKIQIDFTNSQTAGLPAGRTVVYALEATRADGKKIRIIQGKNYINPEVVK